MPSDNEYLWIFISIYTKIFLSMINMLFQSIKWHFFLSYLETVKVYNFTRERNFAKYTM